MPSTLGKVSGVKRFLLLSFALLAACAPVHHGFNRLQGAALRLDIPIYEGTPNVIYTRIERGMVSGKAGVSSSAAEQKYRALYNLAEAAKGLGANAVIETVGEATNDGFIYSGRAVSFDIYPPEPSPTPPAAPALQRY